MEKWLKRVIQERAELEEKIVKLETYIKSSDFVGLDTTNKEFLIIQLNAMKIYFWTLTKRINWNK